MSTNEANALEEEGRQRIASEVLELGETLFELALEHIDWQNTAEGNNDEASTDATKDELRAAKSEFFVALRLLFAFGKM